MPNNSSFSWPKKILFLFCGMVVALFVVAMAVLLIFGADTKNVNYVIAMSVAQNLVIFILPVLMLAMLNLKAELKPLSHTLWMTKGPSLKSILLVVLVWIVALPAMNYIVEWNQNIEFPSFLNGLENQLREMETAAAETTGKLLDAKSVGMMIMMVFVVGVLTGLGEEIFFRSGMLGTMLYGKVNKHIAVWIVAVVFSAFHLQFFGFVPRLLLGAWLGYLLVWTGEVWTPIIAHALNNGSIVLMIFLANNNYISDNYIETIGANDHWLALGSAAATVLLLVVFMRKSPKTNNNELMI
ncbi:MAG: CPBP family intramembrane metalloprotease [Muribaculaceae bacterium]|nr:CPBP family intramembrane metalloprotease [Muribaculaceae bacterium]